MGRFSFEKISPSNPGPWREKPGPGYNILEAPLLISTLDVIDDNNNYDINFIQLFSAVFIKFVFLIGSLV